MRGVSDACDHETREKESNTKNELSLTKTQTFELKMIGYTPTCTSLRHKRQIYCPR